MMIINLFGIILFLRMKFMDKIVQLPKITLRQLEEKLRVQSNSPKRGESGRKDSLSSSWQPKDIKISSPFYLRQQHHKQKCECQYHRMKRAYQESIQRLRKKEQYQPFQLTRTQPTQLHNAPHPDNTARHKEPTQRLSAFRLLVPLGSNGTVKDEKGQEIQAKPTWRDREIMGERSVKLQKIQKQQSKEQDEQNNSNTLENNKPTNLKTNRTLKSKHKLVGSNLSLEGGTASCRINANNSEFISMISQRLQNNKYKDKYLKTLFSFIKMKTNANRQYMWDSKAYLENNLNILLNHYNMKKLVQVQELQPEETEKIAYYMNCLPQKVPSILGELGTAVSQMQLFLSQLKKKRIETVAGQQAHQQNSDRFENLFETDGSIKGDDPSNRCTRTTNSLLCEQDANQNASINNILTNRFNTTGEQEDKQNSPHNNKGVNLRKSMRQMGEFESQSRLKRISQQRKEESEEKKRISVRQSQTIQDNLNRSTRSTVLGIVDEVQKQHRFSKRLKKTKPKKIQFLKKYSDLQIDERYSSINYQKFCHKKTFISLISQIERLDQNDIQRAQHFYRELNVEEFLDNAHKIDELVQTFQLLMSDKTKEQLLKHIVAVRDKRYIEKLQRQLDDMLGEIKKNDPRRHNEDFFQIRENTRLPSHNPTSIVEFKHHKPERMSAINKIIYYEANEQIEKRRELQKDIKLDLAQADLRQIIFEQVKPGLVQSIYHSSSSKKQSEYEKLIALPNLPNLPNQKKILQFMKRNFSTTFNYLANEINSICRSLEKDEKDTNA